jgi:hypothetical protein
MNKSEMKEILTRNGVEENVVYEMTDTNIGDLLGVEETIQGWVVYYSEHGKNNYCKFVIAKTPPVERCFKRFLKE